MTSIKISFLLIHINKFFLSHINNLSISNRWNIFLWCCMYAVKRINTTRFEITDGGLGELGRGAF